MLTIKSENVVYKMSDKSEPVAYCESGDMVEFQTLDCFNNELLPEEAKYGEDNKSLGNPATGPLYINGAMPGDTLKVEIIDILVGALGVNVIGPFSEGLKHKLTKYETRRIAVEDDIAKFNDSLSMPIDPMIGVIGVAPSGEEISTIIPGVHGGNMDCRQIKKGAVLYLPVFAEGALLAIGDLHALMGDGEIGGCGLEIEGTVIVRVSVLSDKKSIAPSVHVDGKWITIASCKTLDEAAEEATEMMLRFLVNEAGMNSYDAGVLLSLCGNLVVCQMVNPNKTVRMELPLSVLGDLGYVFD
ncbi:acetamidase/formamidase family protein [Clostridium folliculivorans]|uniref:acetamidase/formamidase family protein n=1 Tax=Clostridium folliculivorans TaxID=2886038 RepID=UPI0021C48FB6|nr:acetamidase/formamidase family protein [Clostridium folliculivorans]GKU32348.1 acetamidase [Clostridium folliculivorans]